MKKYKVLFCDLDGTLIETLNGGTFPKGVWDMKIKFDVLNAIKKLAPKYIFIVSNQGGIASGYVNEYDFIQKLTYIECSIKEYCNIIVDGTWCDTNNEKDTDRKPNTGMLEMFYNESYLLKENITKEDCLMIGDASGLEGQWSDTDKKTAENFGIDYMDVNEFIKAYN